MTSILKIAIRTVYSHEKEEVKAMMDKVYGDGNISPEEMTQTLVDHMNDANSASPLTLR